MSERRLRDSQRYPVGGIDRTSSVTRHASREQKRERDSPTALLLVCMFDFVCAYTTHIEARRVGETIRTSSTAAIWQHAGPALYGSRHLLHDRQSFSSTRFLPTVEFTPIDWTRVLLPQYFFYSAFSRFACYVRFIRMRTAREPFRASG